LKRALSPVVAHIRLDLEGVREHMERELLDYFAFLPSQMLAPTPSTLDSRRSVSGATISTDLDEKSPLLRNGFLNGVGNWQTKYTCNATIHTLHANILFPSILPSQNKDGSHNH